MIRPGDNDLGSGAADYPSTPTPLLDALEEHVQQLTAASEDVQWFALSYVTKQGTTVAFHSKNAPKRPRGLS